MIEFLGNYIYAVFTYLSNIILNTNLYEKIILILPYLLFDFPLAAGMVVVLTLKVTFGLFERKRRDWTPPVSVLITAYNEGKTVKNSIESMLEQNYRGYIQVIVIVDGAKQNRETYEVARKYEGIHGNKEILVIPKWERGGRASSLNLGLNFVKGEITLALDGDTSYDRDMIKNAVSHFSDERLVALSGNLRIRNWNKTIVTKFQAIEYAISIYMAKQFLDALGLINNISGAFGIFKTDFLNGLGGWDAGTAEDLDLTLRFKKYRNLYPDIKLGFAHDAIGLTDGPETWAGILKQRRRWDGDLVYLYFKKHTWALNPKIVGWREALYTYYLVLIQNFALPVFILLYYIKLFLQFSLLEVLAIITFIYLIYALHTFFLILFFVALISERKNWDVKLIPYTFLFPIYALILRLNALYAYIDEAFFDAHRRTGYVPPWVARKTKF